MKTTFSMGPCGVFTMFNPGVAYYILKNIPFNQEKSTMYVISGGALGVVLLLYKDPEEILIRMEKAAVRMSRVKLHTNPYYNLSEYSKITLDELLPDNAHNILGDRLSIGLTHFPSLKKYTKQGPFKSKEELIETLLVSSYIPLFFFRGYYENYKNYIDGGFSHHICDPDSSQTVVVHPCSNKGESDVYYDIKRVTHLRLLNQDQYMSIFWLGVEMAQRNHKRIVEKLKESGMYTGNE